ncbi:Glutamyl-tRNA(Gln) amidotransferase subunit C mitochondrial [Fasciolopsis buskii]|uniref:Glutamyl-tRNA(Gln) amidotransferase subunit C mitochondrial n=1 Tax=Fasciolopsis buskii TaxID=27845 RepID=A0A8E0RVR2_9TREM|nr:Glutamyl-tRNA(Gln) amidotransferase subunit C mitochondrial [Fasciolopsis buski]
MFRYLDRFIPVKTSFSRLIIQKSELLHWNHDSRTGLRFHAQPRRFYRFVPEKPIWKRFDVNPTFQSKTHAADYDSNVFHIPESALPPRTELDSETVKLLERLSLVEFGTETCLRILEEAIRFADPLLTDQAFRGTTDDAALSFRNTEPMVSLCEELYPQHSCPLADDEPIGEDETNSIARELFRLAPVTWEGYVVAPPGNIALEPKGIDRSPTGEIPKMKSQPDRT